MFGTCPNVDAYTILVAFWHPDGRLLFKLLAPTRSTEFIVVVSIIVVAVPYVCLNCCVFVIATFDFEVWFMPLLIFLIVAGDLTIRTLEKESVPPAVSHAGGGLPFGPSATLGRSPPLPVLN